MYNKVPHERRNKQTNNKPRELSCNSHTHTHTYASSESIFRMREFVCANNKIVNAFEACRTVVHHVVWVYLHCFDKIITFSILISHLYDFISSCNGFIQWNARRETQQESTQPVGKYIHGHGLNRTFIENGIEWVKWEREHWASSLAWSMNYTFCPSLVHGHSVHVSMSRISVRVCVWIFACVCKEAEALRARRHSNAACCASVFPSHLKWNPNICQNEQSNSIIIFAKHSFSDSGKRWTVNEYTGSDTQPIQVYRLV